MTRRGSVVQRRTLCSAARALGAALTLLAVPATGCGGGDDDSTAGSGGSATSETFESGGTANTGGTAPSNGEKITCYMPSFEGSLQGACTVTETDAAGCAAEDGMVVETCPAGPKLNGCCLLPPSVASTETEQCWYGYPNAAAAMSGCNVAHGQWSDTP